MAVRTPVRDVSLKIQYRTGLHPDYTPNKTFPIPSSYAVAVAKGHIVYLNSGNINLAAAGTAVLGVVDQVFTADGVAFKEGYRPASIAAFCTIIPITLVDLLICEDGVGDLIATSDTHVDIAAQSILQTSTNNYDPGPMASVLLDSSTAASSAGSLTFEILGPDDSPANIRPQGDTTSPRRYIVRPVSSLTQSP